MPLPERSYIQATATAARDRGAARASSIQGWDVGDGGHPATGQEADDASSTRSDPARNRWVPGERTMPLQLQVAYNDLLRYTGGQWQRQSRTPVGSDPDGIAEDRVAMMIDDGGVPEFQRSDPRRGHCQRRGVLPDLDVKRRARRGRDRGRMLSVDGLRARRYTVASVGVGIDVGLDWPTGVAPMHTSIRRLAVVLALAFVSGMAPVALWAAERLAADTPRTTALGNTFVAPLGWTLSEQGRMTLLEAPEGGSFLALFDVPAQEAATAEDALAGAWAAYPGNTRWPLMVTTPVADRDGWTDRKSFGYRTSPNEKRDVGADVRRANDVWTVTIYDLAQDVGEKRGAQVSLVVGKLLPKGRTRESFAGRKAHTLDPARIAKLTRFVETSMQLTGVPGVSLGLYQDGRVVFAGGFGIRELGKPDRVDADTRYMIASNTKAMATLMLAKLVDAGKLTWDTPATRAWPAFALGDAETTRQVLIKHLICACTGMPRQDLEWLLEYEGISAADAMKVLAGMQPTSAFGELFQYSNPMAAAAGYIGGQVAYPDTELGAGYDRAMQHLVFEPLGMSATTHDFTRAQQGNFATAHAPDIDGRMAIAVGEVNRSVVPVRPAGGAWSSVNDVMKYVAMELADGLLPDGKRYISRDALLARRAPQVVVGTDVTYGMGLQVNNQYGTPVVHHGGDMIGFHSDMMWLPEHGVGAVILTNGDPGWLIRSVFRRKLLEVLFDGNDEADGQIAAAAQSFQEQLAAERKLLTVPPEPAAVGKLAERYANPAVGAIDVRRAPAGTTFDFGEWASPVASKGNPDGTVSFVTIVPGFNGLEFVAGAGTLILRDAQHEYVLRAQ